MKPMQEGEIKAIELAILDAVADFCDAHGLRYYLAYGTLIGALRHKGFIPWDDDIDIQMPREDYNRLIASFDRECASPHLKLIAPTDPLSRHAYVKIIDTRTVKIERDFDYRRGPLGVDIDIFPLDGQPDAEPEFERWYAKLQKLYWRYHFNNFSPKGSLKRRLGVPFMKLVFNKKRIQRQTERLHARYPYEHSCFVGAVESCHNSKGNRAPRALFEESVWVEFEGRRFKAPAGYDAILKNIYGSYMELPPEEKRVTHHTGECYWKEGICDEKI